MDDTWEDDCSVSESSSNCAPHHDLQFREFNNPHFNGGYDRNNPEGSNDHSDGKRFSFKSASRKKYDKKWYSIFKMHKILLLYIY